MTSSRVATRWEPAGTRESTTAGSVSRARFTRRQSARFGFVILPLRRRRAPRGGRAGEGAGCRGVGPPPRGDVPWRNRFDRLGHVKIDVPPSGGYDVGLLREVDGAD